MEITLNDDRSFGFDWRALIDTGIDLDAVAHAVIVSAVASPRFRSGFRARAFARCAMRMLGFFLPRR